MAERAVVQAKKPEAKNETSISRKSQTDVSQSFNSPADRILFLQRTIGNQAVQRLIKSGALQAKLRIGQPGDKYEQEADRVADAVMWMPEPGVQRQEEPEEEEEEMLQAKSREDATSEVPNDLESQINAIKSGGHPLPESTRSFFEPRFGRDFGQVRVHSDAQAYTVGQDVMFSAG